MLIRFRVRSLLYLACHLFICCFRFKAAFESGSVILSAAKAFTFSLEFKQPYSGRFEDRLEFTFQDTRLQKQFIMTRMVKAVVGDKALFHELMPKEPYTPPKRSMEKEIGEVVGGVRRAAQKAIRYKAKLPPATIPKSLHDLLSSSEPVIQTVKQTKEILPEHLTCATYATFFKNLLWIEEIKMEYVLELSLVYVKWLTWFVNRQDLIKYDLTDVVLSRHNNFYWSV
jgi:helicase MOV-10